MRIAQHREGPQSNRRAQKWQTAAMTIVRAKKTAVSKAPKKAPKTVPKVARNMALKTAPETVPKTAPAKRTAAAALNQWHVYLVRCADDTLYTGVATDVRRRLAEHNGESRAGARYTRTRRPVTLVYQELAADRSEAGKREYAIKQLPRSAKLALLRRSKRASKR